MAAFIDKFREACGSRALAWLLLANCGIFLVVWMIVIIGNYAGYPGNFTMQWLCVSSSAPVALRHFWTAATYMVTHYGFLHLLFNMLWLFWFGRILMTSLSDRHLTGDLSDGFFEEMQAGGTTVVELSEEELKVFQEAAKSVWTQVEEQMGSESYQKLIDFVMEYQSKK